MFPKKIHNVPRKHWAMYHRSLQIARKRRRQWTSWEEAIQCGWMGKKMSVDRQKEERSFNVQTGTWEKVKGAECELDTVPAQAELSLH